jgi:plasmid maintenance system killer protein
MKSHATERYCKLFRALPQEIRVQAFKAYAQFKRDPSHPSLTFELIDRKSGIWSARINDNYRVLGVRDGGEITWYWVGTQREYEKLIDRK